MKRCPKCKTKNQNNAAFCENCGNKLKNKDKMMWIGILCFCFVGLLVVGVVVSTMPHSNLTIKNTNNSVSTPAQTVHGVANKTYSKDGITFNYPENWTLNPNGFLTIGTGNSIPSVTYNAGINKISISEYASEPPAISATMDAVIQDMRKDMTGTYDKKEITVAGEKGIKYIPTSSDDSVTNGKKIDVYFAKGDTLYNIHLATTNYDADLSGFNMIVNTIKVST